MRTAERARESHAVEHGATGVPGGSGRGPGSPPRHKSSRQGPEAKPRGLAKARLTQPRARRREIASGSRAGQVSVAVDYPGKVRRAAVQGEWNACYMFIAAGQLVQMFEPSNFECLRVARRHL